MANPSRSRAREIVEAMSWNDMHGGLVDVNAEIDRVAAAIAAAQSGSERAVVEQVLATITKRREQYMIDGWEREADALTLLMAAVESAFPAHSHGAADGGGEGANG